MRKKIKVRSYVRRRKGKIERVRSHWRRIEEKLGNYRPVYFYGKGSPAKIEVIKMGDRWFVNVGEDRVSKEGFIDFYVSGSRTFSSRKEALEFAEKIASRMKPKDVEKLTKAIW